MWKCADVHITLRIRSYLDTNQTGIQSMHHMLGHAEHHSNHTLLERHATLQSRSRPQSRQQPRAAPAHPARRAPAAQPTAQPGGARYLYQALQLFGKRCNQSCTSTSNAPRRSFATHSAARRRETPASSSNIMFTGGQCERHCFRAAGVPHAPQQRHPQRSQVDRNLM